LKHGDPELFAEVLGGKVVGYHARSDKGKAEATYFHETDPSSSDIDAQRPVRDYCWVCIGEICWLEPCRF
jgi:hypothetical protein